MTPRSQKSYGLAAALLMFMPATSGAPAEFVVKDVQTSVAEHNLQVSARVDLTLSEAAEQAVDNGVPLTVLTEFEVQRSGALWNETLSREVTRARLRYHALSSQYVVEDGDSNRVETYRSVTDALRRMGSWRSVTIALPSADEDRSLYRVAVRSRLDINALPPPLRVMAFFSPDWRLASEWTKWQINP